MVGPDEGEPQTRDGHVGRAAVRLQRRVHAGQPFGRFAHACDCGDTGAGHAAAPQKKTAPRAHVSDEEARKPRPDLPPDQRALLVIGAARPPGGALDSTPRPPRGRATRCVDLSRRLDALHLRRADHGRGAAAAQPLPPHLPRPGERPARRGRRAAGAGRQELPGALRHPAVAVGAARALHRGRTAPLPRPGERRRDRGGRDRHLRRARRHQEGRAQAGEACARSWRRPAARRRSRRWRSWPRSSRRWRPR